jgi:hypothetical protein
MPSAPLREGAASEGDAACVGDPTADRLHRLVSAIGGGPHVGDERLP